MNILEKCPNCGSRRKTLLNYGKYCCESCGEYFPETCVYTDFPEPEKLSAYLAFFAVIFYGKDSEEILKIESRIEAVIPNSKEFWENFFRLEGQTQRANTLAHRAHTNEPSLRPYASEFLRTHNLPAWVDYI
jgi:predicted amidophosphoribosyltransferase